LGGTLRVADQGSIPWRIHWRRWQFQPTFLTTGRGERAPRTVGPGRPAVGAESLRRPRPEGPVARVAGETGSYPWRGLGRGGAGDAACLPAGRAVARAQQIRGEKCGLDQGHKAPSSMTPSWGRRVAIRCAGLTDRLPVALPDGGSGSRNAGVTVLGVVTGPCARKHPAPFAMRVLVRVACALLSPR